jgi:cold shock protein
VDEGLLTMIEGFNDDLPDDASSYQISYNNRIVRFSTGEWRASELGPPGLANLFEQVQDQVMESIVGGAWPRCPLHGTHPSEPKADGWHCSVETEFADSGGPVRSYGTIHGAVVLPERLRGDGEVRWYSARRGWGVIAHHEGDLWVHMHQIAGNGYRSLEEGQLVQFQVENSRQGRFRGRAIGVSPVR